MAIKILYSVILGFLFMKAACISSSPDMNEEVLLTIDHYKVPCTGAHAQLCYRVKKNDSDLEFFYDPIEGFEYEWGYAYTIRAEKIPVDNPMADAPSVKYKLIKVLRKEKALPDETFELSLMVEAQSLIESKNGVCYYFGEVEIQTGSYTCQEIAKAQAAVFSHNPNKVGLVLVKLK